MKRKSSTKSDYTCSYCNKIFKDHVTLPCNDNICAQHLRDDLSGVDCKRVFKLKGTREKKNGCFNALKCQL